MKSISLILGTALASLLAAGCASTPVVLAPVGPGPYAPATAAPSNTGSLQVYSALVARGEGDNPEWYQHSHYYIEDRSGREKRYVDNNVGHYEKAPRTVHLTPGTYMVKAKASGNEWVEVPVIIKRGETTILHLDGNWNPANAPTTQIVSMPDGYAVGWRGDLAATGGK